MAALAALAAQGCLSGTPKEAAVPKPKAPPPAKELNFSSGTGDAFGPLPKREKRWTVNWQSMKLNGTQKKGLSGGKMLGVSGVIYKEDKKVLNFKSDRGSGDKANETLVLDDHVVAKRPDGSATLTADEVTYLAKSKLLIAKGNVHVFGPAGDGTFSELVATSDLNHVGTPDMFGVK